MGGGQVFNRNGPFASNHAENTTDLPTYLSKLLIHNQTNLLMLRAMLVFFNRNSLILLSLSVLIDIDIRGIEFIKC